uniref:Prostate and testis expressed 10 n=1 Tax=Nannospalax galili TaxID=1026970 RepID=A0A8C6QPE8_NANGA
MDRFLSLLFLGGLLSLCQSRTKEESTFCTSCDEFVGKTCRRNSGVCQPRYPDFACQTKEVYVQHYTGEYVYLYSTLSCPRRCVEYMRITKQEKSVFICCHKSYCNSLSTEESPLQE